jgi:hypothetical protein
VIVYQTFCARLAVMNAIDNLVKNRFMLLRDFGPAVADLKVGF